MTQPPPEKDTIEGVVTARKCECCGHHEIGVVTDEGEYVALKPGMRIVVIHQTDRGTNESSHRD